MKPNVFKTWLAAAIAVGVSVTVVMSAAKKSFPEHWGAPPKVQTRDYVRLPGGYGHGSSTLANWIRQHLAKDREAGARPAIRAARPIYHNDFQRTEVGQVPADFLVLNGAFAVKEIEGNKVLELPGAPVDDYALLFGPAQREGIAVTARIYGTRKGRRYPVLAIGVNGLGGYEMQLAPAKRALELFKGEERVASVPCKWESGTWTRMRLQLRQVNDSQWKVEGKVWKDGTPEPGPWLIHFDVTQEPPPGRPLISGHPFSGTPIRFDDLTVTKVGE